MEERYSSNCSGSIESPDLSPPSSHMADSEHDDTFETRHSHEDCYVSESHFRVSEHCAGKKMTVSKLRERCVRAADKSATYCGEPDAAETEPRFSWRIDGVRHDQQSAKYCGVERRHRVSHREERDQTSCSIRERHSRGLSERRRKGSESPRRHHHFDGYRYREELERRRRCWKSASIGSFLRRRYTSLSFSVSRVQSRPCTLYRRKLCHPARRARGLTRSAQKDSHDTRLRNVTSNEPATRESDGRFGSSPSSESEALTEPPVLLAANSQAERIIPQVPLTGYHLQDPRDEHYAPGFRGYSICEGHKLRDHTTSAFEEHNAKQLYDTSGAPARASSQIHSDSALALVICADNSRSDMCGAENRDKGFAHYPILHTRHHRSEEFASFCARCPRPIEYPVNYWERSPTPEEHVVSYPPMSEGCLVTNCPRPLENGRFPGRVSQAGGPPLEGLYERGTWPEVCFQALTTGGASTMNQAQQQQERSWWDYQRDLTESIVEAMIHTVRLKSAEVDALRYEMRDLRLRITSFVAAEKKAQERSLAFIAAVKERMGDDV